MTDQVYLNALFDLAMEEAASGDAWFPPETGAVLYMLLNLSQSVDPHWRFGLPRVATRPSVQRATEAQSTIAPA